ncbi:MAG: O-antigen ligase family protein [Flavobacteriaceae bacterium]|nr:O-antigen ligase family protein [Flavobacteriaceae bacterium]
MNLISRLKENNFRELISFESFFTLLIFTFPFANAFMYPFLVLSFIFFLIEKRYKEVDFKHNTPLLIYIAFVLFLYIQGIINQTLLEDFRLNSKLFIIFFLFLFTTTYKWKDKNLIGEKAFIYGVTTGIIISIFRITKHWFLYNEVPLSLGSLVNDLLIVNRPYLGIFIATSLFIQLKNISNSVWSKNHYYLVVFQLAFLIFISARLAVALSIIILVAHFVYQLKNQKKKLIWLFIGFAFLLSALVFNPIMQKRFKVEEGFKVDVERVLDHEPRYVIYSCALRFLNEGIPFFGFSGNTELQTKLNQCYEASIEKKKKRDYYLTAQFHTHNAFLNFTFLGGWLALFLFILLLFYPITNSKFSMASKCMIGILISFLMFENVLYTNHGSMFFGILFMYFFKNEKSTQ